VIDETIDWLKAEYESIFEDGSGEMEVHRGKVHKYLGMSLDFTNKGQCIITMNDYLAEIVKAYDLAIAKHDDGFLPMTQSIVKVPTELIKLHKNVELSIDCFFVNKHVFFTTISTKICFTTIPT